MINKEFNVKYQTGQILQHIDGGFYKFEKSVWFADDEDELVIYAHIWPFPIIESARRASEFLLKFTPVSNEYFEKAQETSCDQFQLQIRENKKQRREKTNQK